MSKYTIKKQKSKYGIRLLARFLSLNTLLCSCTHTNHILNAHKQSNHLLHGSEEANKAQSYIDRLHNVSLVIPGAVPLIVDEERLNHVESSCNIQNIESYQRSTDWPTARIVKCVVGVGLVVIGFACCGVAYYYYWPEHWSSDPTTDSRTIHIPRGIPIGFHMDGPRSANMPKTGKDLVSNNFTTRELSKNSTLEYNPFCAPDMICFPPSRNGN